MMEVEKVKSSDPRDSNIELFRIITMFMIVAHHYVVNSGMISVVMHSGVLEWNSAFILLFGAWGKTGINCFLIITGYFMCKSKLTAKKFARLFLEVMFYRIIIYIAFIISGQEEMTLVGTIKILLPIRIIEDGFVSCFLLFYLFIPFINILIKNMCEKQHILLLALSLFMYCFFGTVPGFGITFNYVTWFIVVYLIAAYIRIYPKQIFDKKRVWGWLTIAVLIIDVIVVLGCTWICFNIGYFSPYQFVQDSNTALAVATSICAFLYFKNLKIVNNKFINTVAASTFGVLLIHAHSDTMRNWLWVKVLDNAAMVDSSLLIFHAIGSVIFVYIICTFIDYLRIKFIEKPIFSAWDKYWNTFIVWYKKVEIKICKKTEVGTEE